MSLQHVAPSRQHPSHVLHLSRQQATTQSSNHSMMNASINQPFNQHFNNASNSINIHQSDRGGLHSSRTIGRLGTTH
ncbi:unnamed protein product [Penicillium camemberti]|uniref:Str. FM013 n=1 Tax=Penicillium camemberti (strain FM 013) TaxID=1429867 RepID=A0A0G4PW60_PENC3|nr:unnamed protein product [Penicillium camemberti]